jgi:hypothetical protein
MRAAAVSFPEETVAQRPARSQRQSRPDHKNSFSQGGAGRDFFASTGSDLPEKFVPAPVRTRALLPASCSQHFAIKESSVWNHPSTWHCAVGKLPFNANPVYNALNSQAKQLTAKQ